MKKVYLVDGIYDGYWSSNKIILNNGYEVPLPPTVSGQSGDSKIPVRIRVKNSEYEIIDETKKMTKEEAQDVLQRIRQEGFLYCFESYSNWDEISDKRFHELRIKFLNSIVELKNYLSECSENEDYFEEELERGETVVCEWGYNDITKKPFKFLYDFGYYNTNGDCIVYNQGESNMQDAHCFKRAEVRKATSYDLDELFWGH